MFAWDLVVSSILANWRTIAGAGLLVAAIVGGGLFWSSWKMRGARVERLTVELETVQLQYAQERASCAEIAARLAEQDAAVKLWRSRYRETNDRLGQALRRADEAAARLRDRADEATASAVEAVEDAETEGCAAQVEALARELRRWP